MIPRNFPQKQILDLTTQVRHLLPVERASRPGIPRIDVAEVARQILAGGQLSIRYLAADVADIAVSQPLPVDVFHLTTGQKFDNFPPGNKIEVFAVRHQTAQQIESDTKNAFGRIAVLFQF